MISVDLLQEKEALYSIRLKLIYVSAIISGLMLSGLIVVEILYASAFNPLTWYLTIIAGCVNISILYLPWHDLLKKNFGLNLVFFITCSYLVVLTVFNYFFNSDVRTFPYVVVIFLASLLFNKKKFLFFACLTSTSLILLPIPTPIKLFEVLGINIYSFIVFYFANSYKRELTVSYIKSKDLEDKVNQLKKIDTARQTAIKQLMEVQEIERKRIARELHDEIGQTLNGMLIALEIAYKKMADGEVKDLLEITINEFEGTIIEIDRIIWALRPTVLDDLGLESALRALSKRYTDRIGVSINFKSKLNVCLSSDYETVLYRFSQEALNNVSKHSQATKADLQLSNTLSTITMKISDNGIGFTDKSRDGTSMGLLGIRERLSMFGGNLSIITSSEGTILEAMLPLNNNSINTS